MSIMAAHVRNRNLYTIQIRYPLLTGIRHICRFLNRKRIHIAADHKDRTVAVFENTDDTRNSDLSLHLEPEIAQLLRNNARRSDLHKAQLRVLMDVLVDILNAFRVRVHSLVDFRNEFKHMAARLLGQTPVGHAGRHQNTAGNNS